MTSRNRKVEILEEGCCLPADPQNGQCVHTVCAHNVCTQGSVPSWVRYGPGGPLLQKQCHPIFTLSPEIHPLTIFPYFIEAFYRPLFSEKCVFRVFPSFCQNSGLLRLQSVKKCQKATFDKTVREPYRKQRGLEQRKRAFARFRHQDTKRI